MHIIEKDKAAVGKTTAAEVCNRFITPERLLARRRSGTEPLHMLDDRRQAWRL
jgi:hypothetical protein